MQFNRSRKERGQSLLIVSLAMAGLLALMALTTDAGNAYVQRRVVQNAVDAAALAGGVELSLTGINNKGQYNVTSADQQRIWAAVLRVAQSNRVEDSDAIPENTVNTNLRAYFVGPTGQRVDTKSLPNASVNNKEITGIVVEADKKFETYFARLVGFPELQTRAGSTGMASPTWCPATSDGLFPIAVNNALFTSEPGGKPVFNQNYSIWDKRDNSSYGNFGYLWWNNAQSTTGSSVNLESDMNNTNRSGSWRVGDFVPGSTGVSASEGVEQALAARIDNTDPNRPSEVIVPVYDSTTGTGNNFRYRIVGFAKFELRAFYLSRSHSHDPYNELPPEIRNAQGDEANNKVIVGRFKQWVDSYGEAGGGCYGGSVVKLREPLQPSRDIVGAARVNQVFVSASSRPENAPVDVMLVVDVSSSMNAAYGTTNRMDGMKTAVDEFLKYVEAMNAGKDPANPNAPADPTKARNDYVGLTVFPHRVDTFNPAKTKTCATVSNIDVNDGGATDSNKQAARIISPGTNNIAYVRDEVSKLGYGSGNTPTGHGLQYGYEQLMAGLRPGAIPVMVLVTDGVMNVESSGLWTGCCQDMYRNYRSLNHPCNNQAKQYALDMANLAKENGVMVFTIGVGAGQSFEMDGDVVKALASPDFDYNRNGRIDAEEMHAFIAPNPTDLKNIYAHISNQLRYLATHGEVRAQETAGYRAAITLRNVRTGSVRTAVANNSGAFSFANVEPGTYRLSGTVNREGIAYDIITDGNGGDPRDQQYIEVVVGEGTGVTEAEMMYLATNDVIAP